MTIGPAVAPVSSGGPTTIAGVQPRRGGEIRRPVRVMHVVYTLQPGGMEFGVIKLVNGLDRGCVASSICSTTPASAEMKTRVPEDVPVFELQRRPGSDLGLVRDLHRLFRRERPDIVHTHAWGTLLEGLIASRLARVPMVVHGEHGTLQLRSYQRRIQRLAWGRVDQVVSVSRILATRMAEATGFPVSRIRSIPNGVDLARFRRVPRELARQALALPLDTIVIGTAGRLVPVKDHVNLIEALAVARAHGLAFTAVVAGDGPLRAELQTLTAACGLTDHVRFLGHRSDIETVYPAFDVFTLSSRSEGMSNTILEAMASGLPVVATAVGGAEELIDDGRTGLLVPAHDAAALALALTRLASDPALRLQMGTAGQQRAEREFSLEGMVRNYERFYVELAGNSAVVAVRG